ncbi:MAG: ABC transporter substrate-binding protein [Pyrinomonadaceae bacterium]|nr:ABC transporter substrate-binding protein [Phycisphaerales bacterium]
MLTLAHSPDADDAFMWWPITGKVDATAYERVVAPPVMDTGRFRFRAVPCDIEQLNRRAIEEGDLDITAMSMHAASHVADRYVLTCCGSSMGDGYGPKVIAAGTGAERAWNIEEWAERVRNGQVRVAVPGTRTTAFLVLSLLLGTRDFRYEAIGFEHIAEAVAGGTYDAGVVIHDAQLTYKDLGLGLVVDLGAWWSEHTGGLPLPLGANAVKRDLDARYGPGSISEITGLLRESIRYALAHRDEAMAYARTFAPGVNAGVLERFVEMYVNDLTGDMGARGEEAVRRLLKEGAQAGFCPPADGIQVVRPSWAHTG